MPTGNQAAAAKPSAVRTAAAKPPEPKLATPPGNVRAALTDPGATRERVASLQDPLVRVPAVHVPTAMKEPYRRPTGLPPAPADNPLSAASIEVGKRLFHDKELSQNRTLACNSCHMPEAAWADRVAKPIADNGRPMARRSQTIVDVAWQDTLLWDGRFSSLETFSLAPISSPSIMGLEADELVQRVSAKPDYVVQLGEAYPDQGVSPVAIARALSSYMRTIRSPFTRFDQWIEGNTAALSESETRGFLLFNGKGKCAQCHSGWRLTDQGFRDIGLPDTADPGRSKWLPLASMANAFKTPTLRGVADRPPYMHDGSLPTLEAVVEHYDRGGIQRPTLSPDMGPLGLTADEKRDLVAFLRTLSSDRSDGPAASTSVSARIGTQ